MIAWLAACSQPVPHHEVVIEVGWDGASGDELATAVLEPLEAAIRGVPGVQRVHGVAADGLVCVRVGVEGDATDAIRTAITEVGPQLPAAADVPTVQRAPTAVAWFGIPASEADAAAIRAEQVPGVVDAAAHTSRGALWVDVDIATLRMRGLDALAALHAFDGAEELPGGQLEAGERSVMIRGEDPGYMPMALRDVAIVRDAPADLESAWDHGNPAAVLRVGTDGAAPDALAQALGPDAVALGTATELSGDLASVATVDGWAWVHPADGGPRRVTLWVADGEPLTKLPGVSGIVRGPRCVQVIATLTAGDGVPDALLAVPGVRGVRPIDPDLPPQPTIEIDRERAANAGIPVADLRRIAAAAVGHLEVSSFARGGTRLPVYLRFTGEDWAGIPVGTTILGQLAQGGTSHRESVRHLDGEAARGWLACGDLDATALGAAFPSPPAGRVAFRDDIGP
jgi:hypothetical protein